ncbi:hypothetical protein ABZ319_23680 [Nocardia sp. NPDC005978]|uniref:hypothetical protein n=1 Tax=Nocardia sp. NPDC005978 TaxID=3156725 RepID=UPI0033AE1D59
MREWILPEDLDDETRRLVLRTGKELMATVSDKHMGIPVWQFPARAFEISLQSLEAKIEPMSAEMCLELLAHSPIRIRLGDGTETTTSVTEWATGTEQSILETIADFEVAHETSHLHWDETDGTHVFKTFHLTK